MGTTWITASKIAGPIVGRVEQMFQAWSGQASGNNLAANKLTLPGDDYPRVELPSAVAEMEWLADSLEQNATSPPVVHFRKYVDPWTTAASLYFTSCLGREARLVLSERVDLMLLRLTNHAGWEQSLARASKSSFQFDETGQFYQALYECVSHWSGLLEARGVETAIVLAFRSVGGCWDDEEVLAGARSVPEWFRCRTAPVEERSPA
jgi:hypothetical protein